VFLRHRFLMHVDVSFWEERQKKGLNPLWHVSWESPGENL
jgi:hypothetical protein